VTRREVWEQNCGMRRALWIAPALAAVALAGSTSAAPSAKKNGKIVFHSQRGGNLEIFTIGSNGTGERRLTTAAGDDCCRAVWSPDGRKIAFSSERDGNAEIYVMDADGGGQKRLTTNPRIDFFPSWSPDGKRIVFSRARGSAFDRT
jgi:Tol biopolymer transport system component